MILSLENFNNILLENKITSYDSLISIAKILNTSGIIANFSVCYLKTINEGYVFDLFDKRFEPNIIIFQISFDESSNKVVNYIAIQESNLNKIIKYLRLSLFQ